MLSLMRKLFTLMAIACLATTTMQAQKRITSDKQTFVHEASTEYEYPTDPLVLEKLDKWQDLKFGIMFHWGVYSVPGIAESWALCSEDRWFTQRRLEARPDRPSYGEFKEWYWGLSESFKPTRFEPSEWASFMKKVGFKYLIFTTKHHDGFCMFDSKYTDYTVAKGPYKNGKYANIAYHVFDAFRKEGFMIGAYFSKPDWHNEDYWDPFFSTPTRNPNYNLKKHPKKWEKYQKFVAGQIDELMSDYGSIDILWLDGGWVRKPEQDIKLDEIVDNARKKQPGLIAVDRTVPGRNENYQTPEQAIPEKQQNFPWESCVTLSNTWGWNPNPKYKSTEWVINTLAEVVAKGGCLALNVGPDSEGIIDKTACDILNEVGKWLDKNGEAIYATRITPNYNCGNVWFTANKNGKTLYAVYALPEGEKLPATIEWIGNIPNGRMTLLQNGKSVKYNVQNGKVTVTLPKGVKNEALAFRFNSK